MEEIDKLMKLIETDIDEFIKYHNELGLDFIKKDREEHMRKDWELMKQELKDPDTYLQFKLQLANHILKNGVK